MMTERQRRLDARIETHQEQQQIALGSRADLTLPMQIEFAGRPYVVAEIEGALYAYSALCPHQLGPLHAAVPEGRLVTCPWHGYRFDVADGSCVSGQSCQLPAPPRVSQDGAGQVFVDVSSH
jgi:nitrite reductase/ring-hydroxylating ferredoxin subunit